METNEKIENAISKIQSLLRSGISLSVGWSGGKDSTCVLILLVESIRRLLAEGVVVPKCWVTNANTRREMPAMDNYIAGMMLELEVFLAKARPRIDIEVVEVTPGVTGRFTWTTIGRGKLPSYPGMGRDCAVDEKIRPQQRMMKSIKREAAYSGTEIVQMLGVRADESAVRGSSMRAHSMDELTISEVDGLKTFAVIADWDIDDVWDLIAGCSSFADNAPRYFTTFVKNFSEMTDLYRDANEGVCGVIVGDKGNRNSACGSRFGCFNCVAIGDTDRSLESMIAEDSGKYAYMAGLVKYRKFMNSIRWDMSRRDFRGRSVKAGYLKITPDYLSPETKRELYRYLVTLDALEIERARAHEEAYYDPRNTAVEQDEYNLMLTQPQFQFVSFSDVLCIDFCWSIGRDFINEASPAAKDWIDIHERGIRYHVPELPSAPKSSLPSVRWFDVSEVMEETDGLAGTIDSHGSTHEVRAQPSEMLTVEDGAGYSYLDAVRSNYYHLSEVCPSEISRAAIHYGWIKMRPSDLKRYDEIAKRNDYLVKRMRQEPRLGECPYSGDTKLMTMNEFLVDNSISDTEHQQIVTKCEREELLEKEQADLFGVDTILDEMHKKSELKKSQMVMRRNKVTQTESVVAFQQAASQLPMFTDVA
jgi:3'-phosphoadenosine 5'-phosphosulfate sulfotransferase (PAPS reductase)/FAD synthetase